MCINQRYQASHFQCFLAGRQEIDQEAVHHRVDPEALSHHEPLEEFGFPVLVLPTDRSRPARREFAARRLDHEVDVPVVEGLRAFALKEGYSFFAVVLGALALLLARLSGQRRFVIAFPAAEQPVIGQMELVGHCVNLLPFVVELRDGETVRSFFGRAQQELGVAHDHATYTLVSLLEEMRPVAPAVGVSAISAGLTSVKRFQSDELPQLGFTVDYDASPKTFESFEWYLNAVEDGKRLLLTCHYDTGLFNESTITEWLAALDAILVDVVMDLPRDAVELARLDERRTSRTTELQYMVSPRERGSQNLPGTSAPLPGASSRRAASSAEAEITGDAGILDAMRALWQRVLSLKAVLPDDDFFALGGHSMAAVQLFALIERELGVSAPLSALYDAPTPRSLVTRLTRRGDDSNEWQSLVPINRSGSRYPLFLVHRAEGNVLLYRDLAAHLGSDQPVYGLQSAGLDGKTPIEGDFARVARRYIKEIQSVQSTGPYMLGGYCLGGTLALEMARQLLLLRLFQLDTICCG